VDVPTRGAPEARPTIRVGGVGGFLPDQFIPLYSPSYSHPQTSVQKAHARGEEKLSRRKTPYTPYTSYAGGSDQSRSLAMRRTAESKPLDVLNADFYRKISSYPPPRATGSRSRPRAIRSAKKVGERAFDAAKDEARQASDREEKTADSKDEKEGTASEVKAR
jgi:hypothetical protein